MTSLYRHACTSVVDDAVLKTPFSFTIESILKDSSSVLECRLLQEALLPLMPTSYGVHNILSRKKLLLRRARSLPGYQELAPLGVEDSLKTPDPAQSYRDTSPAAAV